MSELDAGALVSAGEVEVPLVPVPSAQVVAGSPSTGSVDLDEDMGIGVWEMTPGAMSDVEIDEVFVVVAGSATVEFVDPALPSIELETGAIVRLDAGMRTVWTVRETLRLLLIEFNELHDKAPTLRRGMGAPMPRAEVRTGA